MLLGSACNDEHKDTKTSPNAVSTTKPQGQPKGALTTSHATFTDDEYATVSALVGRMIPKDDDPGAIEAHVPEYIDRILQTQQLRHMKEDFIGGLAAINRRSEKQFKTVYASATPAQQDDIITQFKDSPESSGEFKWYEILLALTMEGFLGDPTYGGNQGKVGWGLMGFDLVGHEAAEVEPDYKGSKVLDSLRCGTKKGC